jgi:membrane protein YqaA with SNARE-associated domain
LITSLASYASLFSVAFVAATILPAQSELGLAALILSGDLAVWSLVLVASLGNTLGAVVNWVLGRSIDRFGRKRWFPASESQIEGAARWYSRWGRWSLLLSWMPIGGDALTVVAGILREPLPTFVLLVGIAKTLRYLAVAGIALQWL